MFVGEERDLDKKLVSFFCVNQTTGKVHWQNISFDEPWWIGIEAVHRDMVFLHGFAKPDMPDHKRIIALDLRTGHVAWQNDYLRFVLAVEDSVFASKDTANGRIVLELDRQTGSPLRSLENVPGVFSSAKSDVRASMNEDIEFPHSLGASHGSDEPVMTLVYEHCTSEDIVGPFEVIEKNGFLFFSCHEKCNSGGQLKNTLKVVDPLGGQLVFTETLDKNLRGVISDSFFVGRGMLYFVKDRSALTGVNIADLKA